MEPKTPLKVKIPVGDKAKHYLAPWALSASAMPAAVVTHALWGGDPLMDAAVGGAAVLLTGAVHTTWSRRHEHTRLLATVYAGVVTGWVAVGTAVGPVSHGMVNAWAFGGIVMSALWNIKSAAHSPAHETDKASGTTGDLDLSKVGGMMAGAVAKITKRQPGRVEADVQLKPGNTAEGVEAERGTIASLARIGTEQVTVLPNRTRADKVTLAFSASPDQRKAVRGFTAGVLGRSIADAPLVIGQRIDGADLAIWLVGKDDMDDPRALSHTLVTGMTGAGKTETLNTLIIRIRETCDAVPIVADPAKFAQSFGLVADALEIAAKGKQQANALVRNLASAIEYRAELLGTLERADGTTGYSQWVPECWTRHRIPAVFIDIEEATDVLSTVDDEFDEAIRKARSTGIHLCASLQTAHHGNIKRPTRGQFGQSLCHGVKEDYDAKFALTEDTLAAGADPVKWQAGYPGSMYAELVGVPPEQWSTEARAYGLERSEKRALLEASRPTWAHLDPGTAMRLGRGILMPDAKVVAGLPGIADDPESVEETEESVYTEGPEQEPELDPTRVRTEDGEEIDVTQPIPAPAKDGPRVALGVPRPDKPDYEGTYRLLKLRIAKIESEGGEHLGIQDVADLVTESGVTRGWMYKALDRLEENGRLAREDGSPRKVYRIRARELNGTPVGP